jgi:aryl-alcohol dehydrogenase-like predicted oxidoreductase
VLATCEELGIGFLPFSPLGADFLTGTTDTTTRFEPLAPKIALRWIAKLATAGERIGASGESTIVDQVISFLARTLATEGGTLASDAELRADFLAALDVFLRVGWPGAIDLALKIETLFR